MVHSAAVLSAPVFARFPAESRRRQDQKELIFRTTSPRNGEPGLANLMSWLTPTKHFYVRSHAPNPEIATDTFRLSVEGLVDHPLSLTLPELSDRFERVETTATLTCAGNRRTEHNAVQEVGGVQWEAGAIGNATWGGVRLSDVLKAAGVKPEAQHVWFEGLDAIEREDGAIPFGGSIPLAKAFEDTDAAPGAMLATAMNGRTLTADHGFPLRSLVPGYIGARSVKWLGRIVVSDRPSPNHYVAHAYKLVQDTTDLAWEEAGPLYRYPVNSVICFPTPDHRIMPGNIVVFGYSLAGGEADCLVSKVEVTSDDGSTWKSATFTKTPQPYCWAMWTATIPVTESSNRLMVRATDSYGRQQPQFCPWNAKGYFYNAWHSVQI